MTLFGVGTTKRFNHIENILCVAYYVKHKRMNHFPMRLANSFTYKDIQDLINQICDTTKISFTIRNSQSAVGTGATRRSEGSFKQI